MADNCALPKISKCYDDDEEEEEEEGGDDDDDGAPTTTGIICLHLPNSGDLYFLIFILGWFFENLGGSVFIRGYTLAQRLTLDPWGPISPRSPSLPVFPYKINSIFIRRHLLVLALALQKVDSTGQLISLILSCWTAILATSSSGPIRSKGG